ncbi:retrovirus-related pol polyprotein from transposon TNT 1-94 [Tanacetum coccineum]
MLAPGNYVQWKSESEIHDTKPNSELIHYCLHKPTIHVALGLRRQSSQLLKIILTGIDNDIYSTVDACPNACEMWKAIKSSLLQLQPEIAIRSQQSTRNRGKAIVTSSAPTYDPEPATVTEDDEMSKEKEIDKLMALISLSINKSKLGYDNQRTVNVVRAREMYVLGSARTYHKEKMLLCKQEEAGVQLNAEQADWKDDTDDESDDQELEAHYMYMAQIQEVTPDPVDNSGPIFDDEPMHKVQNNNDNYNVFAMENKHPEQPESSNDIYLTEQGDTNITIDSLDICYDRAQDDQDDTDDLDQERDLLASLIQKLKCEIDDSKNRNKFLESFKTGFSDNLIRPILGYGDMVQGTIAIKRVYYVEGLNHNLFSVGQFCDVDLEVAFWKSTCYIHDLKGNYLLTGSRGTDLYSITLQDSTTPNPICLMAKATSSQAWLWHRRLSHLNFDTINLLSKNNIVNGLPKLKFVKDHLCSSCELGKAKKKVFSH